MGGSDGRESWSTLARLTCRSARCYTACSDAWESWGVHHHSVASVVIGLAGRSQLDIADGEILLLAPGDVVLLAPWVWHIHRRPLAGGSTLITGQVGPVSDLEIWHPDSTWFGETPWAGLHRHVAALGHAATAAGRLAAANRLINELAARTPQPRQLVPAVQQMASYAWRMRTQPITAHEILAASGLSYSVAHDLFVRHFAETPKRYLLRTRLSLAQHLLRAGRPLATVWREAGFASRPDLSRRFRLATGSSPLAWQRAQNQKR